MQVSLDLIFATPGETLDEWRADLDAAIALEPDHVSTYGLTFEQGTAFWSRRLRGELGGGRRRVAARHVRARDRSADGRRLRALRSLELRPARLPLAAQPGVLVGRRLFRGRPGRRRYVERRPRNEPSQHDDVSEARARRRVARRRARRVIGRSAGPRTVGVRPAANRRRIATRFPQAHRL